MNVTFEPIQLLLKGRDVSAQLVLYEKRLCAVMSWLDPAVDGEPGWFVEASFGRLAEPFSPTFPDLDAVRDWVIVKLGE